jgi:hypothetical protein
MTNDEAIKWFQQSALYHKKHEPFNMAIKALSQQTEDAISRQAAIDKIEKWLSFDDYNESERMIMKAVISELRDMPSVTPKQRTGQYEKHIDHTDCIWYGNDSGCPVTCSQYRDGWNDAMDYIFRNGKGYQPYRHDG